MKSIQFEGHTFKYDERAPKRWSIQKAMAMGDSNPAAFFEALDKIFLGKSDEYAETLGDDADKMLELFNRVSLAVGEPAKN